jgi:DNA-binding NtrC family response regulator
MKVFAFCSHPETQRRIRAACCGFPIEIVRNVTGNRSNLASFAENLTSADLAIVAAHETEPCRALEIIELLRGRSTALRIIVASLAADLDHAITAFRMGVSDYLRAPWSAEELLLSLRRTTGIKQEPERDDTRILGRSPEMARTNAMAARAALTESNVLITGETGTGKELMAQYLHQNSIRRSAPFVCVNCAALPEGLLESELFGHERGAFTGADSTAHGKFSVANGGVVLDEIGDMSLHGQARLLRAIENREIAPLGGGRTIKINVRILAATNQNLERLAAQGTFRADLLFRLNVLRIHLPPLRERRMDIPELLAHFIAHFNRSWGQRIEGFSPEASQLLAQYDWPGNIRELRNAVEAAYVNASGPVIYPEDLPAPIRSVAIAAADPSCEKQRLTEALFETNWNVSQAAQKLQWSRMTVYRKLARYQIRREGDVTPL